MKNRVVLSSPKAKGDKFENTVLELDQNSRWFRVVDNTSETSLEKHNGYEQVIKFVIMAQRNVKKKEIVLAHNGENGKPFIGASTITSYMSEAIKNGRLVKSRTGYYTAPKNIEGEIPLAE